MTITIDLPHDTLEALRADAGAQGWPAEQVAADYFTSLFTEDDEEAAINAALDELEAGQGRPFAEFAEELSSRFAARYETR